MIRNVFGNAVTKSTLISLPEYDVNSVIRQEDLAMVALALKNSHDEERLRDECTREETAGFTLGWIYNATGAAITLVDSRDWRGGLASLRLYPIRIENAQWGVFRHKPTSESFGAVVYEGLNSNGFTRYWCVAWRNQVLVSSAQVLVWIQRGADGKEYIWKSIQKALEDKCSVDWTKGERWRSVISASAAPHLVFEALLTLERL